MNSFTHLGQQTVFVIGADFGTSGEVVLRTIASSGKDLAHNRRIFSDWEEFDHLMISSGKIMRTFPEADPIERTVKLIIGSMPNSGLFLQPSREVKNFSVAPLKLENGVFILPVAERISKLAVKNAANEIIAAYVMHGYNWINANGEQIRFPFGWGRGEKPQKEKKEPKVEEIRARRRAYSNSREFVSVWG